MNPKTGVLEHTRREPDRSVPPAPSPSHEQQDRRERARVRWAVLAVALLAAVWAVAGSLKIFPLLSDNNDEAIYLMQSETIREGHLFPPAPAHWEGMRPWLSVYRDGHYVFKYAPVYGAFLAACKILLGSERAGLGLVAFAAVISAHLLAREIIGKRRPAMVAALFYALSPALLLQSTMFLSYLPALAVLQGFAAALLAAERSSGGHVSATASRDATARAGLSERAAAAGPPAKISRKLLMLSGFLAGLAVFMRPFEALLFGAPFACWLVYIHRHDRSGLLRRLGWVAVGAALPLATMLVFFKAATGRFFEHPFNLLDPLDRMGFGARRMVGEWGVTDYTPLAALGALAKQTLLVSFWTFGGLPVVVFVLVGLRRFRLSRAAWWLGLVTLTVPAGYFFFWGSYGSIEWGGPSRFGPYYYLPMLAPLAILGAQGFTRLWGWNRRIGSAALGGMVLLSGLVTMQAIESNRGFTTERRHLQGPLEDLKVDNAVVFLPDLQGPWLMLPFSLARNPSLEQPVIWALDRGAALNLDLLDDFPGRTPYLVSAEGEHGAKPPSLHFTTRVNEAEAVRGEPALVDVVFTRPPTSPVRIEVTAGLRIDSFVYDPSTRPDNPGRLTLEVGAGSARFVDPPLKRTTGPSSTMESGLEVAVWSIRPGGDDEYLARDRVAMRYRGARVEMLLPAAPPARPAGWPPDVDILPHR